MTKKQPGGRPEPPRGNDPPEEGTIATSSYTILQRFFLGRLESLVGLRAQHNDQWEEEWQGRLVSLAIYSTYRDCQALGLDTEARAIRRQPLTEL